MYNKTLVPVLVLLLAGLSFSEILEYGEGGEAFASSVSAQLCQDPAVSAAYVCTGNVVRADLSQEGAGSVFYKPDSRVVACPEGPPSQAGAECVQLMMPNSCPEEPACVHSAPAQEAVAPEPEVPQDEPEPAVVEGSVDPAPGPSVAAPDDETSPERPDGTVLEVPDMTIPRHQSPAFDSSMDNLALLVGGLGVIALVLLFTMFKNSIEADS